MYLVFFDPQLPVDDDLLGYFPTVVNRVSKLLFIIFEVMAHRQTDRFSSILLVDAVKGISFSVLMTLKFAFLVKKPNLSRNLISLRKEN